MIPRKGLEIVEENFARIAKWREILAIHQDKLRAHALGLGNRHELLEAKGTSIVVACRQAILLLDANR